MKLSNIAGAARKALGISSEPEQMSADEARRRLNEAEAAGAEAEQMRGTMAAGAERGANEAARGSPRWVHAGRRIEAARHMAHAAAVWLAFAKHREAMPRARAKAQARHDDAVKGLEGARARCETLVASATALVKLGGELEAQQQRESAHHQRLVDEARARLAAAVESGDEEAQAAAAEQVEQLKRQHPHHPVSALQERIDAVRARRLALQQQYETATAELHAAETAEAEARRELHGIDAEKHEILAMQSRLRLAVEGGMQFDRDDPRMGNAYCIGVSRILNDEAGPAWKMLIGRHDHYSLSSIADSMRPQWAEVMAIDPMSLSAEPLPVGPTIPAGVYSSPEALRHFGSEA